MQSNRLEKGFNQFIAWLYGPGAISQKQSEEMWKAFRAGFIVCYNFFTQEIPKVNPEQANLELTLMRDEVREYMQDLTEERG